MKKESKFKKFCICIGYLLLILVCILGIYFLISASSSRENDNIVKAQDSETYFRNVNPNFVVDFVNNEYIRFEASPSLDTLFKEGEKLSIWQKIKNALGVKEDRKGIQISLIEVSYDTDLTNILEEKDITPQEGLVNRNFELVSLGREFGSEEDGFVSKDTVVSRNIYKGVDIEYQIIEGKGLKEEIVLNELPEYTTDCAKGECSLPVNRFLFKLTLQDGLELKKSIVGSGKYPNGLYYIVDSNDNYIAHFLPEFAVDALGNKTSKVVSDIVQTAKLEYIYEIVLDPEWLLSGERVFPIRIDPSVVHDSEELFDQGVYDKVSMSQSLMIELNSTDYKAGTYTSDIVDIGENNSLHSISWKGYSHSTGDGELPFSKLGLIFEENFNDLNAQKKKWGSGALQLDTVSDIETLEIPSEDGQSFTLEFWSYKRFLSDKEDIVSSNLGTIRVSEEKYIFEDLNGIEHLTDIPVKYNKWQYIAVVFSIDSGSLNIYIDEFEYTYSIDYLQQTLLDTLSFNGSGYIDTVRVYNRGVARNELMSNSQYSDLYLQYMTSIDGINWSDWSVDSEYVPDEVGYEGGVEISSEQEDISSFNLLTFRYLSDLEQNIIIGKDRFVNGLDTEDTEVLDGLEDPLEPSEAIRYIDLVFVPNSSQNSCILSLDSLDIYTLSSGEIVIRQNQQSVDSKDRYILNEMNYLSLSLSDTETVIYLNGNPLAKTEIYSVLPSQYSVGSGCSEVEDVFDGDIENVRISNTQKSLEDILGYHNIEGRKYILKPSFQAQLQSDTQVESIDDTEFSINQMPFGQANYITTLNIADTVVITEGEYQIEGEVLSLNQDTGLVQVQGWIGNFPSSGFSVSAKVLKYEREYIPKKVFLDGESEIYYLNMVYGEGLSIDRISLFSISNPDDTVLFDKINSRYIKYRYIFTSSKYGLSPSLSSVNIEFLGSGPNMEQIMRHGKWFNSSGVEQSFWWAQ